MQEFTENLKLHDKYQFEVKFTYPLNRKKKINEYHVDAFFFLPASLSINPMTYSKTDYYNDTYDYIRLKTPSVLLSVMTSGPDSPMRKLEQSMRDLASPDHHEHAAEYYAERIRVFSSILRSALRDEEMFLENSAESPNFRELVMKYARLSSGIAVEFRSLRIILENPAVPKEAQNLFSHADEYISLILNKYRIKLHDFLEKNFKDSADDLRKEIVSAMRSEIEHRKERHYPSVPDPGSENEEYLYRESCLKKAMGSVLYLKTNVRRDGVILENIVFGLAAGIAMTFASLVAYLTKDLLVKEFTTLFAISVIIAYMCKDRIKELSRAYFYSKIKRYIYDYKTTISSSLGKVAGLCKESFNFIQESDLSSEIMKIRNKSPLGKLENGSFGENVILSRKHITLYSDECKNLLSDFNVDGIVNIMRFNVRKFLWKMDNPSKLIRFPGPDGKIITAEGKRVYHVNVVFKYGMEGMPDRYARFRLVLSRSGIKRIESFPVVESALKK